MEKDDAIYVEDIVKACQKIIEYTEDFDADDFIGDSLTQDAVLRNFEVIGEAANKLPWKFVKTYPKFPIKDAIAMRNKVIHEYKNVDLDIVWDTVKKDIPRLLLISKKILKDLDSRTK
ncbi:hypothetical protein COT49_00795 [candidate division WWE3 bacterium CG08_land_8_20_14_0_20_40_13]|uniref:DUF86 domain-containing protein n=1 Tax=candidate division WWE3 bacterium CG08_land_8_20_14_0_20_40_13 TaxID=1975084 RepID=A0A2H0XET1_UNCKA|nr:MAG: hypothetical protein COT49_00795 [candidate division WWE3 bacterium CG08_land_8_20_14_0_20_40_13]